MVVRCSAKRARSKRQPYPLPGKPAGPAHSPAPTFFFVSGKQFCPDGSWVVPSSSLLASRRPQTDPSDCLSAKVLTKINNRLPSRSSDGAPLSPPCLAAVHSCLLAEHVARSSALRGSRQLQGKQKIRYAYAIDRVPPKNKSDCLPACTQRARRCLCLLILPSLIRTPRITQNQSLRYPRRCLPLLIHPYDERKHPEINVAILTENVQNL